MRIAAFMSAAIVLVAPTAAQVPRLQEVTVPASLTELDFVADTMVGLTLHPSGCLLMSDVDESQLVCVNLATGSIKRLGRRGSGPGEFGRIAAIAVAPNGEVVVHDAGNSRLTTVKEDWTFGVSQTLAARISGGLFEASRDSVLALGGVRGWNLVSVSLSTGTLTPRFAPGATDSALFDLPAYRSWGFHLARGRGNTWLVASLGKNAVVRLDASGKRISLASRNLPPEYPSPDERDARRDVLARMGYATSPEQQARLNSLADAFMRSPKATASLHGFGDDAAGRLWVVTPRRRADSTEIDVFNRGGTYLGTRRISGQVQGILFAGADLFVLREVLAGPQNGSQGVSRFRLVSTVP